MIKTFRNLLALLLAVIIFPSIWAMQGLGWLNVPEIVLGATVSIETMIAMFYYRKKAEGE